MKYILIYILFIIIGGCNHQQISTSNNVIYFKKDSGSIIVMNCSQTGNIADKSKSIEKLDTDDKKSNSQKRDNRTDSVIKRDNKEKKIYDFIFALPEVKDEAKYIEKHTNGKRRLIVWIYQTPNETDEKCYWVKAGEDNGEAFVTHFNFFVSPYNFEIKYFDTLNDTLINLDTWRKERKNSK